MEIAITGVEIVPAAFPLNHTFRTARGQKNVTENVLVKLSCSNEITGFGEAASSLAMPESRQETMLQRLEEIRPELPGKKIEDWQEIARFYRKKFPFDPTAISALECALLDAYSQSKNVPLSFFFGGKNEKIETYFTVPALGLENSTRIIEQKTKEGFKKFKVKVTGTHSRDDLERAELVPKLCPGSSLIIDANQGWDKKLCLEFLEQAQALNLPVCLVEQPLVREDLSGLRFLKQRSPFPIAVGESLRTMEDARKILEEDAADVFNLKIAKSGLLDSIEMANQIKKAGKKLMIGCMMESALGLTTSISWACGSGEFSFVDLDSFLLIKDQPVSTRFDHAGPCLWLTAS